MINCFIDPIFMAVESSITPKLFSNLIFPKFNDFIEKIKILENSLGRPFICFNISQDFIIKCFNYNPFRFNSNLSFCKRFREFLFLIMRKYRNKSCGNVKHSYKRNVYCNRYIPQEIMEEWNYFISGCSICTVFHNRNLELLSCKDYGTTICKGNEDFFIKIYFELCEWLANKFNKEYSFSNLHVTDLDPDSKFIGAHSSHHPSSYVNKILNKVKNIEYITGIRRIRLKSSSTQTKILNYDDNSIEISISTKEGVAIYLLETTANNRYQVEFIIEIIKTEIPELG